MVVELEKRLSLIGYHFSTADELPLPWQGEMLEAVGF